LLLHPLYILKVSWNEDSLMEKNERQALFEVIKLIFDILETKEEYVNLPKPRAGYV
jgi:hypothetical protein